MLDKTKNNLSTVEANRTDDPVVVRFAGDSGDGVQLLGAQFIRSAADAELNFFTFPDYPAEIRAPVGTTFGVSAFQIQINGETVLTPGDAADVLIALNPAALKTNLNELRTGGLVIVDEGTFNTRGLKKAGYESDPREKDLGDYQLLSIDISKRTLEAVADTGVGRKQGVMARNFWVLGLVLWMYGQSRKPVKSWIGKKFAEAPEVLAANKAALDAGHAYGETMELSVEAPVSSPATSEPYRIVTGTQAMALGLAAVSSLSGLETFYCSYPITPASALLHALAKMGSGVRTFQAEDEIAAVSAALGASYGGALGVSGGSGPSLALKTEVLGLAVAAELPLIVIDVQRAGPSTGMPTKTEQADLLMAVFGRHGEAPLPVLAPATPGESFDVVLEAARIAVEVMTPVIVLSDAYLANAAEKWIVPDAAKLPDLRPSRDLPDRAEFHPYLRNEVTLARHWVPPGTPGFAHRIGGLEKAHDSGNISYDPTNHEEMVALRAEKISRIADRTPVVEIETGATAGDVLVIGWGSTYGALKTAVNNLQETGASVGHLHLRRLWPLPRGIEELAGRFNTVVVAELNRGHLRRLLRSEYLIPAEALNRIAGQPFKIADVESEIRQLLKR